MEQKGDLTRPVVKGGWKRRPKGVDRILGIGEGRGSDSFDFVLAILTFGISIFGVIMVFSASSYTSIDEGGTPYSYLIRDGIWVLAGLILMGILSMIDYRIFKKLAPFIMIISILLLAAVFTPLGITRNYATRWIGVGSLTIMPGEVAKISVIIFTSWLLSKNDRIVNDFFRGVLPLLALCGICGGLIMLQPNMSTAVTVVAIILVIMIVAGLDIKYMIGLAALAVAGAGALIFSASYRMERFTSFLHPFDDPLGDSYQVIQSLLALGSGGLFGVGLGNSMQKTLYLPEPQNDFILAVIGEELGFIAILILMAVYAVMVWRGIRIAINAKDRFGTYMAAGISAMLAIQVVLNVAVVTSSMPPTGVILPFVSYGGNATLLFMGSMGILLNISKQNGRKAGRNKRQPQVAERK